MYELFFKFTRNSDINIIKMSEIYIPYFKYAFVKAAF
jgi:hypothetical protein